MSRPIGIGMVGAGTIAQAHGTALTILPTLYPRLALRPRLVAVADVNEDLARGVGERFGFERAGAAWQELVQAPDVELLVVCLPPALNRAVVEAAAQAGKHVVCEKPLATNVTDAAAMLKACADARVFHGLGAAYRWSPALRAIVALVDAGDLGEVRHLRLSFMLDYAADPTVPLLWRFRRDMAGGGIAIDAGYHLLDCARLIAGEVETVQALAGTFIGERPLPGVGAIGNRGGGPATAGRGSVDVEDAALALLGFRGGAIGVLEASRVAIGRRLSLRIEVYGSRGSADWDLERPDEFRICRSGDPATLGFTRVLVNPTHPGAADLLVAGTDGTSIGWLGQECAMWAEFLAAVADGRPAHADFTDGVRVNAVIDALYLAAADGERVGVSLPPWAIPSDPVPSDPVRSATTPI